MHATLKTFSHRCEVENIDNILTGIQLVMAMAILACYLLSMASMSFLITSEMMGHFSVNLAQRLMKMQKVTIIITSRPSAEC